MASASEILRTVLGSFSGKVGLLLLLILGAGSAVAMAVFPPDFGTQIWNNPAYWADYPKTAAPVWWIGSGNTRHQVLVSTSPSTATQDGSGRVLDYRFELSLSAETDPKFLSFSVSQIQFEDESPVISVFLEQDGQRLPVYRYVVPGKSAAETSPVSRYTNEPFRVQLTSDYAIERQVKEFLGSLRSDGHNQYTAIVRVAFSNSQNSVQEVRFVAGGNTFGLLGTDNVGRDIFQGILAGLPIALLVGIVVAFFVTLIGAVIGTVSAYAGGGVDMLIQRIIDVVTMVPTLPIVIFLVFAFGANLLYIILFLIVFGWTGLAIQIRPWIMQIREEGFIALARARGYSPMRIVVMHLIPQTLPLLFANLVFAMPGAILSEAGLSFLGLGDPSLPTWGQMLQGGFSTGAIYLGYWWWVLAPGLAIVLTALAPALISQALESYTEPRLGKG